MRCVSIGLCALQLAVFTGCRSSPPKPAPSFYPIGIYAVPATNDFDTVKHGGFNVITGPAEQGFLDAAQRAGLRCCQCRVEPKPALTSIPQPRQDP